MQYIIVCKIKKRKRVRRENEINQGKIRERFQHRATLFRSITLFSKKIEASINQGDYPEG